MNDENLEKFWDGHEPEDFAGWQEGALKFTRPPKKLIQLRLELRDIRVIDGESKRSGIDRAQLVRSWVKEKVGVHGFKGSGLPASPVRFDLPWLAGRPEPLNGYTKREVTIGTHRSDWS